MSALTTLSPKALPGGLYGSFAGKTGGGGHSPGPLTQMRFGLPGMLYGPFTGKTGGGGSGPHNPGPLTQQWFGLPGEIYGPFTGKVGGGGGGGSHNPGPLTQLWFGIPGEIRGPFTRGPAIEAFVQVSRGGFKVKKRKKYEESKRIRELVEAAFNPPEEEIEFTVQEVNQLPRAIQSLSLNAQFSGEIADLQLIQKILREERALYLQQRLQEQQIDLRQQELEIHQAEIAKIQELLSLNYQLAATIKAEMIRFQQEQDEELLIVLLLHDL